jgi:hypothetical protein
VKFPRAIAILAIGEHPNGSQPLVQTERGILKNRSRFCRELPRGVVTPALPLPLVLQERGICATADRAGNNTLPAVSDHVAQAVVRIGKVDDCLLQCFRLSDCVFHAPRLAETGGFVKYILTQFSPKASAALSRRCLQAILRDKAGTKAKDLYDQIEEVISSNKVLSHIADDLHAVRNIGNFAAHLMKSTATGVIVDVEPQEAEWNLDVLETLFDFYFV